MPISCHLTTQIQLAKRTCCPMCGATRLTTSEAPFPGRRLGAWLPQAPRPGPMSIPDPAGTAPAPRCVGMGGGRSLHFLWDRIPRDRSRRERRGKNQREGTGCAKALPLFSRAEGSGTWEGGMRGHWQRECALRKLVQGGGSGPLGSGAGRRAVLWGQHTPSAVHHLLSRFCSK